MADGNVSDVLSGLPSGGRDAVSCPLVWIGMVVCRLVLICSYGMGVAWYSMLRPGGLYAVWSSIRIDSRFV